jgi:subtilase family serine protease
VDSLPVDPAIDYDNIGNEWGDTDTFTNMLVCEWFLMADLTVAVSGPGVVGLNRNAVFNVTVRNEGSLPAQNASVEVYVNDTLAANWTVDLGAGEEKWFAFN